MGASPKDRLIFSHREERIQQSEVEFSPKVQNDNYNQLLACSCSLDSERFVTGGDDCHIRVYSLEGKRDPRICSSSLSKEKVDGHTMKICALVYHPRGAYDPRYAHLFLSGGWDDTIHVWDDRYQHSLWVYAGPHICGSDALDIDHFSNTILTCSWRREEILIQVWKFNESSLDDVESRKAEDRMFQYETEKRMVGRPIMEIPQESMGMRSKGYVARWIGSRYIGFGGSGENILRIIDRNNQLVIGYVNGMEHGVVSLDCMAPSEDVSQQPIKLAFAAGSNVFVINLYA